MPTTITWHARIAALARCLGHALHETRRTHLCFDGMLIDCPTEELLTFDALGFSASESAEYPATSRLLELQIDIQ